MIEEILYQEDSGRVGMHYEESVGYLITLVLTKWSIEDYKRYLSIWNTILHMLQHRGIMEIAAVCENEKNQKFIELFGFTPTDFGLMCPDGINRRIMRRNT